MKITETLITSFEKNLIRNEKSKNTLDKYVRDVKKFALFVQGRSVTKSDTLEYKQSLMESYSPASVNSVISSLNRFFDFVGETELKLKSIKIQRRIFASREKELTKSEYERLLKAAKTKKNKRLYYLMQTICSAGIRVSEVKFVTVEAVRAGTVRINLKGKMRVIILPKSLCAMLTEYIKESKIKKGPVFVTKTGKPLDRSNIWHDMKNLCKTANVGQEKVFPHNLRHLFARTYYSLEKDIVRLADILGHSSVNTTRIYTMETGDVHRRQIEKLGLVQFVV